jgi:hypothetical protein
MQNLPGTARAKLGHHHFDLDMDCAHPSNLLDCLRAKNIEVPHSLYKLITERLQLRQMLAEYYGTTASKAKKLMNSLTYGMSTNSTTWFDESGIQPMPHHHFIIEYASAISRCVKELIQVTDPDYIFVKSQNSSRESEQSLRFKALSELLNRVEEQKLTVIISRLVTYWGV